MTRLSRVIVLAAWLAPAVAVGVETVEAPGPAYLAYAGPYASSPSSAFGHLFLVLASRPDQPAPLWDVVTFNAVTFEADPIRYLTVGVLGGFLGRYSRLPFHEKAREYELLDDRDLWLVELRLTPQQRARLEASIGNTRGRWYPCDFFRRNCAWYLQEVLVAATDAVPPPSGFVGPTDVMRLVQGSVLAGSSFHRPSASGRVRALATGAREAVRHRLEREDWRALAADSAWLEGLTGPERRLAQAYFALRTLETAEALPGDTRTGLARLRLLDLDSPVEGLPPVEPAGPGIPVPPEGFHRYGRLQLAYQAAPGLPATPGRIRLGYRPAMHDQADPPVGEPGASSLELLALVVSSSIRSPAIRLDEATLFSQRALGPSDWLRSPWPGSSKLEPSAVDSSTRRPCMARSAAGSAGPFGSPGSTISMRWPP